MDKHTSFRQAWQKRWAEESRRDEERRRDAEARARGLAAILASEYSVTRVILFGSVTTPGEFGEDSDIDLAVEGLAKKAFFDAYGRLMSESPYPVDLKPLEDISPLIRARVREGRILYEA